MPEVTHHLVGIEGAEQVQIQHGRRLVLGLEDAGIDILHRCGGNARCATCRVEILAGDATEVTEAEEMKLAGLSSRLETTRLSCQVRVTNDLSIAVCNRLSRQPELGDAGPRPIEWPADRAVPPEE